MIRIKKIYFKINWIAEDLFWFFFKNLYSQSNKAFEITIGITTFMDRFDSCLKPLVNKTARLFPNNQIIVIANGHVKEKEQKEYVKQIELFCKKFKNVELVTYNNPKGLSYIWNKIIGMAKSEKILLLNDDVKVNHKFQSWVNNSGIIEGEISTINFSWSHFLISKSIFRIVGPFDEELIEIGGEDDDYSARLAMCKIPINNYNTINITSKLKAKKKRLQVNSYGKNMNEESNGYSTYNNNYLLKKWEMSNEPFMGAFEVPNRLMKYWKLRE